MKVRVTFRELGRIKTMRLPFTHGTNGYVASRHIMLRQSPYNVSRLWPKNVYNG